MTHSAGPQLQDDLTPVLCKIEGVDAILLGSSIYFGTVSGMTKSFMERLTFPFLTYTDPPQSLFPGKIRTAVIYTMNVSEAQMKEYGYEAHVALNERVLRTVFGASESLCSYDTLQFDDYSTVLATRFDPEKKAKRHAEILPEDCQKAFALGARIALPRMTSCREGPKRDG